MKISVFVSCPTVLSKTQQASKALIDGELDRLGLEPRQLGDSEYPTVLPLREVYVIAKRCSGGIILGFEQFVALEGSIKKGKKTDRPLAFPTEWNHLEAGILFSLGLPLLVFREPRITGGVFDPGVSDVFIHEMPGPKTNSNKFSTMFRKWDSLVRNNYYNP